jgi:integral membrane protein
VTSAALTPRRLYRVVATAEAVTWALLLTGMFLKYVTETTELGVRIGGMLHGAVFLAYCLTTVLLWVDQRWSFTQLVLGLVSAVPPFATVPFERHAEKQGLLGDAWRLREAEPVGALQRLAAWLVRKPLQGLAVGVAAVAGLFTVALLAGPPV